EERIGGALIAAAAEAGRDGGQAGRVAGTGIASVAGTVAVGVELVGVRRVRAIVGRVRYAVPVGVGKARDLDRVHGGNRVEVEPREPREPGLQVARVDAHEARHGEADRGE